MIQTGIPLGGTGGGVPIGKVVTPFNKVMHTEANTILNAYNGDLNRVFLGLLKRWNDFKIASTPILNATELANNIIRPAGFGAELDYLIPYQLPPIRIRANMVDASVQYIGRGGASFPFVTDEQFAPGDVVKIRSLRQGRSVRISTDPDHRIEGFSEGDGWIHQAYLVTTDKDDYLTHDWLTPGTAVYKSDNPGGEHTVHGTSISSKRNGILQQSYKIGNAERRIIHTVTSRGDQMGYNIDTRKAGNVFPGLFNYQNMSAQDQQAIVNYYNYDPASGANIKNSTNWVPAIVEMMYREKSIMKERYLTWGEGDTFIAKGDQKITVGDGWYQQIKKRGWFGEYDDTTKILDRMKDMMDTLFYRSQLQPKDRRIKFTMGMGAMVAAQQAFKEQAFGRNMFMFVQDGRNPILNGQWTGDLQNLKYKELRVISVEFPEYGVIEIEHNPALDVLDGEEEMTLHRGRYANSSYMMWVEDVTADEFSNALPRGAKTNTINGVSDKFDQNVVMVLPDGWQDSMSILPGTGHNPTLSRFLGYGANSPHVAVTREKGYEIIMDFAGEIFVKDPSRIFIMEYVPKRVFY